MGNKRPICAIFLSEVPHSIDYNVIIIIAADGTIPHPVVCIVSPVFCDSDKLPD